MSPCQVEFECRVNFIKLTRKVKALDFAQANVRNQKLSIKMSTETPFPTTELRWWGLGRSTEALEMQHTRPHVCMTFGYLHESASVGNRSVTRAPISLFRFFVSAVGCVCAGIFSTDRA